jgi:hypothetical protein
VLAILRNISFFLLPSTGNDPLVVCEANTVVRTLNAVALAVDVLILLLVAEGLITRRWPSILQLSVCFFAVVAAALTWFELWYGSTFYYGEVRDKQGLPIGVNNLGALGSFCFLAYVIWRVKLPTSNGRSWRIVATAVLAGLQYLVLRVLEEPWKLWQS